jgi:hypothetical protein
MGILPGSAIILVTTAGDTSAVLVFADVDAR